MAQMRLPEWFREARPTACPATGGKAAPGSFVDKNLANFSGFMREAIETEGYSKRQGLLQMVSPRARIAGVFFLIMAAAFTVDIYALAAAVLLTVSLTALSGVGFSALAKRVWPSFVFTLILIFPVFFGFFTPGERLFGVSLGPVVFEVTKEGVASGLFFVARAVSMVSLAALLLLTTGQTDFFRGLSGLPLPRFFVAALFMMFRFVFILLKVAEDSTLARRSRTIGGTRTKESQEWFSSRVVLLLKKSLNTAEEVGMAMASRGFNGKIRTLKDSDLQARDYLWLGATLFLLFLSFGLSS